MTSLWSKIKGFFNPTDRWVCHYWTMEDPERLAETFPTQELAHECELQREKEGYIALVRYEGTTSHDGLILGALQIVANAVTSHKNLASQHGSDLATHVRDHFSGGRGF